MSYKKRYGVLTPSLFIYRLRFLFIALQTLAAFALQPFIEYIVARLAAVLGSIRRLCFRLLEHFGLVGKRHISR